MTCHDSMGADPDIRILVGFFADENEGPMPGPTFVMLGMFTANLEPCLVGSFGAMALPGNGTEVAPLMRLFVNCFEAIAAVELIVSC